MTALRCLLAYLASTLLWTAVNPYGLWQTACQAGGQIAALVRRLRRPSTDPVVLFALPFDGCWTAVNGGVEQATSHSWSVVAQRYAYDFVVAGPDGRHYAGDGRAPQEYHCFGRPILAAAEGVVVETRDDIPDSPRAGSCWIDWRARDLRGNYVVIRHAAGVYSLSAHLQRGSVSVQPGDSVQRGQPIGRCGHSGHSSEPHLHFQVQDHPDFFRAVGLPIRFAQFVDAAADEQPRVAAAGYVNGRRRVCPSSSAAEGVETPVVAPVWSAGDLAGAVASLVLTGVGLVYLVSLLISGIGRWFG